MKVSRAPFQSLVDLGGDEQALANDMVAEVEGPRRQPFGWCAAPCSSTTNCCTPPARRRPPNTPELVLMEIGLDWDRIEELKDAGAIA